MTERSDSSPGSGSTLRRGLGDAFDTGSTRRYYEEHAEAYARETGSADLRQVWRLLTERLSPRSRILDLGCGAGRDLAYFGRAGYRVIGLDYSFNLLKIARADSNQRVVLGDLAMLPFATESFDAVWAVASLLHVPRQRIRVVARDIRKILKQSGVFVASVKRGTGERVDERGRYFADYEVSEWGGLLGDVGFVDVEIQTMKEERRDLHDNAVQIDWLVSVCKKRSARKMVVRPGGL
jgi:SAM-dependent methyltransferase